MRWLATLFKYLIFLVINGAILAMLAVAAAYWYFKADLPDISDLKHVQLQVPLRVFSADHSLIAEFGEKKRIPASYSEIPPQLVQAVLAAEDQNFFEHFGIDPVGLTRAALNLAATGKKSQGGSTITMQVARNFYLDNERSYKRKIREIFLALHIERELTKEEILELYLNKIYLGQRAYGVGAAAQVYYGKALNELSLPQIAMIAGLPKAPSAYNPIADPERARIRRDYVLRNMEEVGYIDHQTAEAAIATPDDAAVHQSKIELEAPYIAEMARQYMFDLYGSAAYEDGYDVYTTVPDRLQLAAISGLRKALEEYDLRHGWRGVEKHFDIMPATQEQQDAELAAIPQVGQLKAALVTELKDKAAVLRLGQEGDIELSWENMKWAAKRGSKSSKPSDLLALGDLVRVKKQTNDKGEVSWTLSQIPAVSGALVSVNPTDGAILALTGGYDFSISSFNRATQAMRQPGSGFKAFIYSAALEDGFTPASIINDAPIVEEDASLEGDWRPENYSKEFMGPIRLRQALATSRNLISIRILRAMGMEHALQHASRFGFDPTKLPSNLSLALGSGEVTPLQMARGYSVFANGGYLIEPYFVQRIDKNRQETVFQANPARVCPECAPPPAEGEADPTAPVLAPRVLSEENRYLMYSMMQDVINYGTATPAKVLKRKDLAGKTGTSNDQRDAWFNGYNQSIVANVWVGFDDNSKLGSGEVGGKAALPVWIEFMKVALTEIPDQPPKVPETLVTVRIDADTGQRATASSNKTMFEVFMPGTEPGATTGSNEVNPGAAPSANPAQQKSGTEDLF